MLLNYMKAYVSMYFLHLTLTFPPKNVKWSIEFSACMSSYNYGFGNETH